MPLGCHINSLAFQDNSRAGTKGVKKQDLVELLEN